MVRWRLNQHAMLADVEALVEMEGHSGVGAGRGGVGREVGSLGDTAAVFVRGRCLWRGFSRFGPGGMHFDLLHITPAWASADASKTKQVQECPGLPLRGVAGWPVVR